MSKIRKIFLKTGFTPIDQSVLVIGSTLSFDCYIQRFNGFVILVEKGTLLDEKIFKKITSNKLQVFVENNDFKTYKIYKNEHQSLEKIDLLQLDFDQQVKSALELPQKIAKIEDLREKLHAIYFQGKNLLTSWLENSQRLAPKAALNTVVSTLVDVNTAHEITLSHLQGILESKYSLETHMLNVCFFFFSNCLKALFGQ